MGILTTLFRIAGTVVLTDPLLTSRYYGYNRQVHECGGSTQDLARVDIVVISHTHPDHNHPAFLRVIAKYNRHLTIVVPSGYAKRFKYAKRYKFAEVIEIPRYESVKVKNLIITNVPAQHGSSWGASGWVFQSDEQAADKETLPPRGLFCWRHRLQPIYVPEIASTFQLIWQSCQWDVSGNVFIRPHTDQVGAGCIWDHGTSQKLWQIYMPEPHSPSMGNNNDRVRAHQTPAHML